MALVAFGTQDMFKNLEKMIRRFARGKNSGGKLDDNGKYLVNLFAKELGQTGSNVYLSAFFEVENKQPKSFDWYIPKHDDHSDWFRFNSGALVGSFAPESRQDGYYAMVTSRKS